MTRSKAERPDAAGVLVLLSKSRILELAKRHALNVPPSATRADMAQRISRVGVDLEHILPDLRRDELRMICRAFQLDDQARRRDALIQQIGQAAGQDLSGAIEPERGDDSHPHPGDLAIVRQRMHMVEAVRPSAQGQSTWVSLVCLDDDAQGRPLEIIWEMELGAQVVQPRRKGLGDIERLDDAEAFRAYLHALRWHSVTATDAGLLQSPFRAGIHIMDHQLAPLAKALKLPRANVFIADDVGLGKTIEAGLIVQELLLRQQIDTILVICPPSVAAQWQDEMLNRFGLRFEIYDRAFVGRRRAERGFAVNPWSTHNRFIVSYQTLRRPGHLDPLIQHLGDRARRSLLILDEAHTVAPASQRRYAVDSALTRMIRDQLAPRFENRLFLSATPHNGHSNSFSALLEILDPQRFTRGVTITDPERLRPIMVRRLKSDLGPLGVTAFPTRVIQRWKLLHDQGHWWMTLESRRQTTEGEAIEEAAPVDLGEGDNAELILSALLDQYGALMGQTSRRGRLLMISLQKRLLSSVAAFYTTFKKHCEAMKASDARRQGYLAESVWSDDEDEAEAEATADARDERLAALADLEDPTKDAPALRQEILELARRAQGRPDARFKALLHWIRTHQCPDLPALGAEISGPRPKWGPKRLIIFTEYTTTLNDLKRQLDAALEQTEDGDERIMIFRGQTNDEMRAEIRRAFNSPPDAHPVRILLATDAAREGINLQGACADLLHFDIPWNPARLEQRNGRIDRTLQPEPEVRCTYCVYPQRASDAVLDALIRKVDTIRSELGSVGTVVLDEITTRLEEAGIQPGTAAALEGTTLSASGHAEHTAKAQRELESQRAQLTQLKQEIDSGRKALEQSRKLIGFEPSALREVIDIGLSFLGPVNGAPRRLIPDTLSDEGGQTIPVWRLPPMPDDWQITLDPLRAPRPKDIPPWTWRRESPPQPVVFTPPPRLTTPVVHLHLEHPFVRRILGRFRAQGYAAHDLSRVTALGTDRHQPMVVAVGRISLFGPGARRLHDELIYVGAPWLENGGEGHCVPSDDHTVQTALERVLNAPPRPVSEVQRARLCKHAHEDFAQLWPHVEGEAEARAGDARLKLEARASEEKAALAQILTEQQTTLRDRLGEQIAFEGMAQTEIRQVEADERHMRSRLDDLTDEIKTEPEALADLFRVQGQRIEPVGLIYLWPAH